MSEAGRPIPSRRALGLGVALVVFALAASWWPELTDAWLVTFGVVLIAMLADLAAAHMLAPQLVLERRMPGSVPIGRWRDCVLRLVNRSRFATHCEIHDHHPLAFEALGLPIRLSVPAGAFAQAPYKLRATERGTLHFSRAEARVASPFGLWDSRIRLGEAQAVRSYPDFAELADYALFATENRLSQIGVMKQRRRGEGLEFHQLRDFREGDSLRQIDWKATARMKRPIAREYQDERDQQIVFLLDCGRRMNARDGLISHFDEVLNAVLLLAFVALRQGDAAGLMTFASAEPRFVPAKKSRETINAFLNALYDVQPTLRPPDYHAAAVELSQRLKRRSLVIVVSNLRDEDEETLMPALALLKRKHLVLFANLRESVLDTLRDTPVKALDEALTYAAGAIYEREREAVVRGVESAGAMLLDVPPSDLAVRLVNRYLELKRSGRF
ncbi:hypothetical protein BWI17_07255 [Betaproteobacteria bacterium GR16-43]|nr:hypothetical protein BWI17_07255 [Betaproteobacteria bacterium GR16-43]